MSSQSSTESGETNSMNHYKLRVEFYGYERTAMESNLQNALEKLQRMDTTFQAPPYKMLPHHNLLEFMMTENSQIPAFEHFILRIHLVHQSMPSCLYFMATLLDDQKLFPNSTYINGLYHQGVPSSFFRLDIDDGYLKTPPLKNKRLENETIIASFQLSILLENLSFAVSPFEDFNPVEVKRGKLFFPLQISPMGQTTQTQMYHHVTSRFNVPHHRHMVLLECSEAKTQMKVFIGIRFHNHICLKTRIELEQPNKII